MALALRGMARTAKTGARLILVLGRESSMQGAHFFNGELVARIAPRSVGLDRRRKRVFRNRHGLDVYEDILRFRTGGGLCDEASTMENARPVAKRRFLLEARFRTPEKERLGIAGAAVSADSVSPSPVASSFSNA